MFMFTARYKGHVQSILVHKEMKVQEFLDALSYSLQLPDGQIVGFQDRNGLIITPSFVCLNSQELRNETYDVLLRNQQQILQQSSIVTSLATPTTSQPQLVLNREGSLLPHNSALLFNANLDNLAQPVVQNYTQPRNSNVSQQPPIPVIESNSFNMASFGNTRTNTTNVQQLDSNFNQSPVYHEEEIIQFVMGLPTDPLLTENVKSKIIAKVRLRDSGIMGAYQMYLVDMDAEGFKARIIHRALSPQLLSGGANANAGDLYCSSATTAQANWTNSRTSTAGGGFRPATRENSRLRNLNLHAASLLQQNHFHNHGVAVTTQDRYLPVILELENKGLLNDEQTASLLKTLVLEENFEVFRVINSYLAKAISDRELSFRLTRLAQQLSTYIERPQSPLPRKKNQLLQYVNSLARYHFNDPDDAQLLNKLVQEENEFILSCFDVFESDKDHDNLIDSLKRILEKSKAMGLHRNSMTASSFYTNNNPWQRVNQNTINQANLLQQPPQSFPVSQSQTSLRFQQPYVSKWESNNASGFNSNSLFLSSMAGQPHFANQSQIPAFSQSQQSHQPLAQSAPRSQERPQGAVGGRRTNGAGNGNPRNQQVPQHFQNTTVHNVALIPNYFSSGEEEAAAVQQQLRQNGRFTSLGNSQVKSTPLEEHLPHNHHFLHDQVQTPNGANQSFSQNSSSTRNNINQHKYPKNQSDTDSANWQQVSNGGRQHQQLQRNYDEISAGVDSRQSGQQPQPYQVKAGQKLQSSESDFIEAIGNGGKKKHYQTNAQQNSLKPPISRQVAASYKNSTNKKSEHRQHSSKHRERHQKSKNRKQSSSESEESESEESRAHHHKQSHKKHHSKKKKQRRDSSSSKSSSESSSHSSSSDSSESSQSRKHHRGSSSKKTSSKKTQVVVSKDQLEKLIKREKLRKNLQPHIFSLFLHLSLTVKDQHLLQMTIDLLKRETDIDFFHQYLSSKCEDHLQSLMQASQITHEEQQRIKSAITNDRKLTKAFERQSEKILGTHHADGYEMMAKVMQRLKRWADKSLAKEQLKMSTQNSERIVHGGSAGGRPPFQGTLRQKSNGQDEQQQLQAPANFNKQKLESNFQMIYYGEFLTKEQQEGAQVKQLYADKNFELLTLLSQYQKPSDYEALKSGIYELLSKLPKQEEEKEPSFPPKTIGEAIRLLEWQGLLNQEESDKLRKMDADADKRLKSAFECFQILKDFDDLTNSLCMLCGKGKVQKSVLETKQQPKAPIGQPKVQAYTPSYQPQGLILNKNAPPVTAPGSAGMGMISLMKIGTQPAQDNEYQVLSSSRRRKQSSEDDHRNHVDEILEINDNPDESAGELESAGANEDEMKSIEEFQQEIIQKYTLQGRFHYYDSLFFHQMVSKRDIRMISIFEVFAVNRNENDFLENMFIYKDLIFDSKNNNEEGDERAESEERISDDNTNLLRQEEETYPNMKYLNQFRERFSEEEYQWSRQALMQEPSPNKTLIQIIECLKIMNDENDFVHSVKQLYKRHTQAMANAK